MLHQACCLGFSVIPHLTSQPPVCQMQIRQQVDLSAVKHHQQLPGINRLACTVTCIYICCTVNITVFFV